MSSFTIPIDYYDTAALATVSEYRQEFRRLVDVGSISKSCDPDELFRGLLVHHHFVAQKTALKGVDIRPDLYNMFRAVGRTVAVNYRITWNNVSILHGEDQRRQTAIEAWLASPTTNPAKKFQFRMDLVKHFFAGAEIAVDWGSELATFVGGMVEESDKIKQRVKLKLQSGDPGEGYSLLDFLWTYRGAWLLAAFTGNPMFSKSISSTEGAKNAEVLAAKFRKGSLTLSTYGDWFLKGPSILYA